MELRKYLETGYGPTEIITDILRRIANTEASWRKLLAVVRATPVIRDMDDTRRVIASPDQLPRWLLKLDEWSQPETEIIADLKLSVARKEARADEALDHVQWSAEDDLESIALVLRLAEDWNLAPGINDHLAKESAKARTQLEELIALIDQARPFSMEVRIAKELADAAKANGEKPN